MNGILTCNKTHFTDGELDLSLLESGDLSSYTNGAKRLRNVVVKPAGGVTRRPGLRYVSTVRGEGRLIAFEYQDYKPYVMVVTHLHLDIYVNGVWMAGLDTPWTSAQIPQLIWARSAHTLLLTHPDVSPRIINRGEKNTWNISEWAFTEMDGVQYSPHHKFAGSDVTLTPSNTVGVITLEASADVFEFGHEGTRFWLAGKQVLITEVLSTTQAMAVVRQPLYSAAATKHWEEQSFSDVRGWPISVCFHQERLVIGGSRDLPNRVWVSKRLDIFNFELGMKNSVDNGFEFSLSFSQDNIIRAVFSGRHLQIFTVGFEYKVRQTSTGFAVEYQTRIGSLVDRAIPPRGVGNTTYFISRDGLSLREFRYTRDDDEYQANDRSMVSKHVMVKPLDQVYDPDRRLFYVVMEDGSLAIQTVYWIERISAWTVFNTDGKFLAVAEVAGEVFVLVSRKNGVFLEQFDDNLGTDSAQSGIFLDGDQSVPSNVWGGLEHLEGQQVRVLTDDGTSIETAVIGGHISLDQPASSIQVGLPYAHEIEPIPPIRGTGEPLTSNQMVRLVKANFRLLDTQEMRIDTGRGLTPIPFRRFGKPSLDGGPTSFSGNVQVRAIGWKHDGNTPLWRIEQDSPRSFTLQTVETSFKTEE